MIYVINKPNTERMQFYVKEGENKTQTHYFDHKASLEKVIGKCWCA
jgi:hypothetical protein